MTQQGDDLDDDMPPGNPFAPTSTAAASGAPGEASSGRVNAGRLLQVLESLTTLVQSQAQSSASADAPQIRGRDLTKVLRPPAAAAVCLHLCRPFIIGQPLMQRLVSWFSFLSLSLLLLSTRIFQTLR